MITILVNEKELGRGVTINNVNKKCIDELGILKYISNIRKEDNRIVSVEDFQKIVSEFSTNYITFRTDDRQQRENKDTMDCIKHCKNREKRNEKFSNEKFYDNIKNIIEQECNKYLKCYVPSFKKLIVEYGFEEDFEMEKITLLYSFIKNMEEKPKYDICDLVNDTHKLITEEIPNMMESFINSNFSII